ncbi:hypothetical protein BE221DRAFT_202284 [Ostreococcus tauri]|uniref:Uncharacterized protein n=1 Tax=Ostreococcus tauri TaxID=70448 RepID=A0A1Y5HWM5_OSTTA|nr:hypothetical protein BE221DRAFT_202284 [Ostreococcus tauri]
MARTGDSRANKATAPSDRAEATRSRSKRREDWQAIKSKSSFKDALSPLPKRRSWTVVFDRDAFALEYSRDG